MTVSLTKDQKVITNKIFDNFQLTELVDDNGDPLDPTKVINVTINDEDILEDDPYEEVDDDFYDEEEDIDEDDDYYEDNIIE
jgi:hypothetical protein